MTIEGYLHLFDKITDCEFQLFVYNLNFNNDFVCNFPQGTTFPALNALLAQWAPPLERGRIGSLVFAGSY